ncbi:MAG: hypothetical protein RL448_285 [Actinomycetota bacterium]|jgi:UDPglucose 6-dehydrogenase
MALKISVIGTGYLGATHAACMANLGFETIGIDTDATKIELLKTGQLPFYEPGLPELLKGEVDSRRLNFSTDISGVKDCDIHFLCVGTPQKKDGLAADLTYVDAAVEAIAPHLKPGALLVGKSTVPVGTAQRLKEKLSKLAPEAELAWNPEFLREGFAVEDTLHPNRLVVGVTSDRAENLLREVYAKNLKENTPWIRADLPTSELVKVAANSFLATKISFINAMAEVCEASGGDVKVLAEAIGHDPRIGNRFLQAGIGFGGGCLPKDIRAFMSRVEELGASQALEFLSDIDAINLRARQRLIDVVRSEFTTDLKSLRISVLGAAFKPDSDDVRDSPALDIAAQLQDAGADVTVHDPKAIANAKARFPKLKFEANLDNCVTGANLILHLTEWREYRELDPIKLGSLVAEKNLIDGRNMLDREKYRAAGWHFHALGRSN